jgi:hypothetical protein
MQHAIAGDGDGFSMPRSRHAPIAKASAEENHGDIYNKIT